VKRVNGQGPDSELYWVSVEGGASQSMGIRMNGLMSPSLNPDGKRLLFSSTETSNELWVLRNLPLK
jgi:Tol biopolymer transport system component